MRFKFLLALAVTTIGQTSNTFRADAEATRPLETTQKAPKSVPQSNLASNIEIPAIPTSISHLAINPDLIGRSIQQKPKPVTPRKPLVNLGKPNTPPQSPTPTPNIFDAIDNDKQVLVSDIVIQTPNGLLESELEAKIRQVLTVKIGEPTTRTQIEKNLNAVRALGSFSLVKIIPEAFGKGIKLSFIVTPYGVLNQVQIKTLPANTTTVLTDSNISEIFQSQYGKKLNAVEMQSALKKLDQLYKKQGYDIAQVVGVEDLDGSGKLTLIVAEGLIEEVQVRFLTKDGSLLDENKKPITGSTRPFIITREAELKPGKIFNGLTLQKDLGRIGGLGLFDGVRPSFALGSDRSKVILQFNVLERKSGSFLAGGGLSSTTGLFGSVSYNQQNIGGNAQRLGAEVQVGARDTLFDINFSDPWIATDPIRTSYSVNAFQRRSLSLVFDGGPTPLYVPGTTDVPRVLRQGAGVTFSRPFGADPYSDSPWRGSLGLQYQRVSIRDANGGSIVPKDSGGNDLSFSKTGQDDLLTLQLGLTQDLRNSFAQPTAGSLLKLGLDQSIPVGTGSILMTRARASFTQYVPVKFTNFAPGAQSVLFNLQGGTIIGDLPPYEAFSLGGSTSVRGYEDGGLGSGRSYLQATAEYRFPLVSILGLGVFADYGSDLGTGSSIPGSPGVVRGKPGSGMGYGAGLRIDSPIGPIRIDYAINNLNERRVQFGIGERF